MSRATERRVIADLLPPNAAKRLQLVEDRIGDKRHLQLVEERDGRTWGVDIALGCIDELLAALSTYRGSLVRDLRPGVTGRSKPWGEWQPPAVARSDARSGGRTSKRTSRRAEVSTEPTEGR